MAHRDAYSPADWAEIALAPVLAGFAVSAADPSGPIGAVRERAATAWSMRAARDQAGTLASEVVATCESAEGRSAAKVMLRALVEGRTPAEAAAAAIARLAAIARRVEATSPAEATAFASWLSVTAATVAEAAPEGGLLGLGGARISDAERRTLAEIDAALGLPPA